MRSLRVYMYAVLCCATGLMYVACDHVNRGIYAAIETEVLVEEATFGFPETMIRTTVSGENRYYLSFKQFFWQPVDGGGGDSTQNWNLIAFPNGYDIAGDIKEISVGTDTLLIASITSGTSGQSGLFALHPDANNGHNWSDNLYRDDSDTLLENQIIALHAIEGTSSERLFVVARNESTPIHTLYHYDTNGSGDVADDRLYTLWSPVGRVHDGARIVSGGSTFLIFTDNTGLYCVDDSGAGSAGIGDFTRIDGDSARDGVNQFILRSLVVNADPDVDGNPTDADARAIGGILIQNETIYVSGQRSEIYRYREPSTGADSGAICDPANWRGSCATANDSGCWQKSEYGGGYSYTDMTPYTQANVSRGILIGVEDSGQREGGYREIPLDTSINTIASLSEIQNPEGNNYTSSTLSTTTVHSFFVDGNTIFALTYGAGVWRGTYSEGVSTWVGEDL